METVEQVNEDFNVKKPKKKGLIIGGIIAVVAIIVALVLVYFLVLTNPKFIFSKAIDKLIAVDFEKYDSIKMDTEIKASAELKDTTAQEIANEIGKCNVKAGMQMDFEEKQEIIELGLAYDNQSVIDAQMYYNDGEIYTYLEGIFDKYIKMDMDEETKANLAEMFENPISEGELKNAEKAIDIMKDEFKAQIKEKGEFEKEKTTIDVGDDEVKVTKSTLTLTEKELCNLISDMCEELSDNKDFIKCFEKSPKTLLEEIKEEMKDVEISGKSYIKISLYTKGILNNKLVAVDAEVYSGDDDATVIATVVKEDKGVYAYRVSAKTSGIKMDILNGKIKIEKNKDSKKEETGKIIITAGIIELGSGKLEIDYSLQRDQGIDKIDTSNSVNMNDLTETDLAAIGEKVMKRPIIGELIQNASSLQNNNAIMNETQIQDDFISDPDTATKPNSVPASQNQVKKDQYSVTYSVPSGFVYDTDVTSDFSKYYDFEEGDSEITSNTSIQWSTESEYIENQVNWDYNYYKDSTQYYKNVKLSEIKTIVVGDKTFKYAILSYESNSEYYEEKNQKAYAWYPLGDEYLFAVEFESTDKEITEDIIKGFLNINVTK